MPLTPRTRAAYLRRMLKRMDEEKPRLDDSLVGKPEALVRRMLDAWESSRAEMLRELGELANERRGRKT